LGAGIKWHEHQQQETDPTLAMRQALFLLAYASCFTLLAQNAFEKIYTVGSGYQFNLNELASGNIVAGFGGPVLLNPQGEIIQASYDSAWVGTNLAAIRRYSENEFYFVSSHTNPNVISPLIGRMDSLGQASALYQYELNGQTSGLFYLHDLEITSDASVITWGRDRQFFAFKVDPTGVPLWSKSFDRNGGFRFIKELPSGDLLAGMSMDTAGTVVARMNADGEFLWCKSYFRPSGVVTDCLIESDDSFILTGFTDSIMSDALTPYPPDYNPKLFLMELNGAGVVQWAKGYADYFTWYVRRGPRISKAPDGNYVVLANHGYQQYNQWYQPFLMKTDQNGDTLWTRTMGSPGYTYLVQSLLALSDGGIMYDGVIYGSLPDLYTSAAFIHKTDSEGHLSCHDQWYPTAVMDLFPTDSSFTMVSVGGVTMQPVDGHHVIFDSIPTYDACIVTSLPPGRNQPAPKPRVHPNPNTGRFTVEFQDPLMAESYYSVYDAMGKLLYQRPLPAGATLEEVDLGRFGKGTYVLKFTEPEGTCYERVLVE
jgi:Secretion system C-terminal sorting domain